MKYAWSESILDSFTFNSSQPTLFYVLSRENGKHVTTFRSESCFAYVSKYLPGRKRGIREEKNNVIVYLKKTQFYIY